MLVNNESQHEGALFSKMREGCALKEFSFMTQVIVLSPIYELCDCLFTRHVKSIWYHFFLDISNILIQKIKKRLKKDVVVTHFVAS